jgi:peptidoglycan/LPS O-acetylase OafA/YrhL
MLSIPHALNIISISVPSLIPLMWNAMYLPFLLIGRAIYLRWSRRASTQDSIILGVACYVSFILIFERVSPGTLLLSGREPIISHLYALVIFLALCSAKIKPLPRFLNIIADISYPLYLVHAPVGGAALYMLTIKSGIPYAIAMPIAISICISISYSIHSLVEKPSQIFIRRFFRTTNQQ